MLVAPHARNDDVVLLATLEGIDGRNLDLLVKLLLKGAVNLHVRDEVGALTLVGSDDADLGGQDARFEEAGDDLFDVRRFGTER